MCIRAAAYYHTTNLTCFSSGVWYGRPFGAAGAGNIFPAGRAGRIRAAPSMGTALISALPFKNLMAGKNGRITIKMDVAYTMIFYLVN